MKITIREAKSPSTKLNVDKESHTTTIEESGSHSDYSHWSHTEQTHVFRCLRITTDAYSDLLYPGVAQRGDELFLVYALYKSGDSFSRQDGCLALIDVFNSKKKAMDCQAAAEAAAKNDNFSYIANNGVRTTQRCPWTGYFERLESVEYIQLDVK